MRREGERKMRRQGERKDWPVPVYSVVFRNVSQRFCNSLAMVIIILTITINIIEKGR